MAKEKKNGTKDGDSALDDVQPFAVVAKKSMLRGGRAWTAGVHVFDTKEKLAELGTAEQVEAMLKALALYPDDFEVKTETVAAQEPSQS